MKLMADTLRFDIEVLRICPPPRSGTSHLHPLWAHLGFAGLALSLPDARLVAATFRAAGGAGMIVPSAYRAPLVSLTTARQIAEQHLEILRLRLGGWFGPLEDGEMQSMWWRFYADHQPLLGDDREPERVCIDVDRVDGHIATLADERQLALWQQDVTWCRPGPDDGPARLLGGSQMR